MEARKAVRVGVLGANREKVDDGLAIFFPGPASYTGEDVLELHLHGGRAVVDATLEALLAIDGVRLAEPGEFTRRAFEYGKLDLTEAEAVADLIDADTRGQREQALRQLGGGLSDRLRSWRSALVDILALVEVSVDFPDEEDAPDFTHEPVIERLVALSDELSRALDDGDIGEKVRGGFRVALIGPPNVGKSSLLNRLAGRDAAIVTALPGTTRDLVEVRLQLAGQLVWLTDTAGLRETGDLIEVEGIRRARLAAKKADLRLLVWDVQSSRADLQAMAAAELGAGDFVVLNKCDLQTPSEAIDVSRETFPVSALDGSGLDALEAAIAQRLTRQVEAAPSPFITRLRHRQKLGQALAELNTARDLLREGGGAELAAENIRLGARALSSLIGHVDVEDVLGAVFSQFCIGK